MEQSCLFGPQFLEKFVGKSILHDSRVALVELIANSWDAGAKEVRIIWPTRDNEEYFSITDNGGGMTKDEFLFRWRTLAYERANYQGNSVLVEGRTRTVFGHNGIGRFAGFCFGDSYFVRSTKNDVTIEHEVKIGSGVLPFTLTEHKPDSQKDEDGTIIYVKTHSNVKLDEESIRAEIGMRFLTDPNFSCYVNGIKVSFDHIPQSNIDSHVIELEDGNQIKIRIIETSETDKTSKQHGIAWHVNGRLVGEASWKDYGFKEIIDGRSAEAKRHTFIVDADFLVNTDAIKADWSGFYNTTEFELARGKVYDFVRAHVLGQTKQKRTKILNNVKDIHKDKLSKLTPLRVERWHDFITEVQEECSNISEKELVKLAGVLVKMEQSDSKYSLISKLHELEPGEIDDLHNILEEWSLDLAKEVLDELQIRLKLLDELSLRVFDTNTREVQDLQPLFHQGLWIFGPEYESIEFTSNQGMTTVIQKLFGKKQKGSRKRPDFAILPDSSVGSYSYPSFDDADGGEIGVARLVVVELKKPGVAIDSKEKQQAYDYVKELLSRGLIDRNTKVTCLVLGSEIDQYEKAPTIQGERITIIPMDYNVVLVRAKSRLLKLYDRVKGAPFLDELRENINKDDSQNVISFSSST